MSLKSVTSKLNSSYNSFTPSRSMSVTGAMLESLKFNLRFRFSLLGMAASLTKSNSLYNIAQQRYVDRADVNRVKEESSFKSNVVNSVSALSRQISLLESVTEKNSAMINMIANDLGYFKRQRKINFLTDNSISLRNSSFRVPLSSRTVKGQIEQINAQLQELKKSGIGRGGSSSGSTNTGKSALLADIGKVAAVGGIAAYLASQVAQGAGGDKTTQQIVTALGGLIGAASIPATSKIIEYVLKQSIPILGKITKIGFALSIAPKAAEVVGGSFSRMGDRFSGKPVIERNYPPNPYAPGSPEYMVYDGKMAAQKTLDDAKSTSLQVFDIAVAGITTYYGAKVLSKLPIGKALQAYRSREMRKKMAGRESFKIRMDRYASYNQKVERYDRLRQMQLERGVRPSKINLGIPPAVQRGMQAGTRIAGKAAPSMVRRSTTAVRRVLGSKGSTVLNKMMNAISSNSLLRKIPVVAIPYIIFELGLMSSAQENLDSGRIDSAEYKEEMTGSLTRLVNTVGVGTMGAIVGATVGTFVAGPLGTLGGALLGFGGSLAASVLLSESGGDSWVAEKLFGVLFEGEMLEARMPAAGAVGSESSTTGVTQADLQAFDRVQRFEGADQIDGGIEAILATIRTKESGNNYQADVMKNADAQARAKTLGYGKASASGAYQFVDSSWQGLTKKYGIGTQYQRAVNAPPDVQDLVAAAYVNEILVATGGDVSKVPVAWYTGNVEGKLDARALAMNPGLSVAKYQESWLSQYAKMGGAAGASMMAAQNAGVSVTGDRAADQAMLNYFISLGAGTTAQMMQSTDTGAARATAPDSSSEAEGKADAALAAVKGTLQEVTRLAQEIKVLQQKNDLTASFPQVRHA